MAQIKVDGLNELMLSMKQVAELPDDVADEMLQTGAEIVASAQKRRYQSLLYDTGKVANSIKISRMKRKKSGDTRYVTVYPQGTHHTYNHNGTMKKATNAEVAFVHEHGAPKRGITAKQIMRMSAEESTDAVVEKEYEVYDKHLKSKRL